MTNSSVVDADPTVTTDEDRASELLVERAALDSFAASDRLVIAPFASASDATAAILRLLRSFRRRDVVMFSSPARDATATAAKAAAGRASVTAAMITATAFIVAYLVIPAAGKLSLSRLEAYLATVALVALPFAVGYLTFLRTRRRWSRTEPDLLARADDERAIYLAVRTDGRTATFARSALRGRGGLGS